MEASAHYDFDSNIAEKPANDDAELERCHDYWISLLITCNKYKQEAQRSYSEAPRKQSTGKIGEIYSIHISSL